MTYRGLMTDSIVQAQRKNFCFCLLAFISLIKTVFFAADLGPNTVEGGELHVEEPPTLTGARGRQWDLNISSEKLQASLL